MDRKEDKQVTKIESGEAEAARPTSSNEPGSLCGFDSLHHLLQASLPPHLFQVLIIIIT